MENDQAPLNPGTMEASQRSLKRRGRRISPLWSIGFFVVLSGLYFFRTDATYAITVWPAWLGASVGISLGLLSREKWFHAVLPWILFVFLFVDEAKSYPRMMLPEPPHDLRVVSLNCAGGTYSAAEEVKAQNPDIVLFQESCGKDDLAKLAKLFFGAEGSYLFGPDASIIARGSLVGVATPKGTNDYVAAEWTDVKGRKLNVVSLRLVPPVMRVDLYDMSAWKDFADNRAMRRTQVKRIADELERLNFFPHLIGGDFNTPPDHDVLDPLTKGLTDTFAKTGVGYGATCVNPYPCVVRIDHIYCSTKVTPTRSRVIATQNSDHRMLVSDFMRSP